MKLLLKIKYLQHIRSFKWEETATLFVTFFLIPIFALPSAYSILSDKIQTFIANTDLSLIVVISALTFQISDFFYKLAFVHEGSDIDDYLRTRPVSTSTLCRFIVLDNAFTSINWIFIPTIATCLFLLLDFPAALLTSLLFIAISLTNGLALHTLFYSHSYESKAIVSSAGFLFFPITALLIWKSFGINWWLHFTVYITLCVVMQYFLYRCLCILRNYPDYSRTTTKSISLFVRKSTLSACGTLRSNWLRSRLCVFQIIPLMIFIMNFTNTAPPMEATSVILPFIMVTCIENDIFGLEANYMDGLWSRPISIKKMLRYNYIFYSSVCIIDAFLICASVFHNGISQVILVLSVALFTIGVYNNVSLAGIYGSARLELFEVSLMKTNGKPNNIFLLIMVFFPIVLFEYLLAAYAPMEIFCGIAGGIGLIGIILHPYITNRVAKRYVANRYRHFEKYRN